MPRLLPIGALLLASSAALAQTPPMDDLLWLSSTNALRAIDRFGGDVHQLLALGTMSAHRAPDGTVWTLESSGIGRTSSQLTNLLSA